MKQRFFISSWLKLALMTLLFTLYGYMTIVLIFLFVFVGGGLPFALKLLLLTLPALFMAFLSALLIKDWKSWAISLPIQAIVYFAIGKLFSFPVSTVLGMLVVNEIPLPNWAMVIFTFPEFATLQALGFSVNCLLRRRKNKKAHASPEETT